jgi:hypothetical protein
MVEAAIVLPLLLLTVLSTILLVMYFYTALDNQVTTQRVVIESGMRSKALFRIITEEEHTETEMRGLVKQTMRKNYVAKHYVFNMGEAIRLGKRFTEE